MIHRFSCAPALLEVQFTLPESVTRARVLSVSGTLATDVSVADRYPGLLCMAQGSIQMWRSVMDVSQAASDTRRVTWIPRGAPDAEEGAVMVGDLGEVYLSGGDRLTLDLQNASADDAWSDVIVEVDDSV